MEAEAPVDPLAEHRALLNEARPFHRVKTRSYDPALRERVAQATREAAAMPPTPHLMGIGLGTTASLAVAVAGNATEAQRLELVESDARRLPICAAVALLDETAREPFPKSAVASAADERLRRLWQGVNWASAAAWEGNEVNGQPMMYGFARVTSADDVRHRLADALDRAPALLGVVVGSCAGWSEQLDRRSWALLGFSQTYREMPPWMPVDAIRRHSGDQLGDLNSLDDRDLLEALLEHFGSEG